MLRWLRRRRRSLRGGALIEQAPGVHYDTVAREWRCRVDERATLGAVQARWEPFAARVAAVPGLVKAERLCCGTCNDFRILVSVRAEAYAQWRAREHEPEAEFLAAMRNCPGVREVHSQLLSVMDALAAPRARDPAPKGESRSDPGLMTVAQRKASLEKMGIRVKFRKGVPTM